MTPNAPSRPSPALANATATAVRYVSRSRRYGSLKRPGRGERRARAGPRRVRPRNPADLAGSGVPAGGDRPGRAWRTARRRALAGARTGLGRTRWHSPLVPDASRPGAPPNRARQQTAHPVLIARILEQLARTATASPAVGPRLPVQPLTPSEIRVLRYLPTHLSAPEIASELSVSITTVKTHMRNLYAKLGAHSRAEAVESARALGLLAPSARSPAPA